MTTSNYTPYRNVDAEKIGLLTEEAGAMLAMVRDCLESPPGEIDTHILAVVLSSAIKRLDDIDTVMEAAVMEAVEQQNGQAVRPLMAVRTAVV